MRPTPVPPPIPHYPQGLKETPAKGTGTPITWEQTDTLWAGDIDKHEMGSNAVRKTMVDGKLVPAKYKKPSRNAARLTFRKIREHFNAGWKKRKKERNLLQGENFEAHRVLCGYAALSGRVGINFRGH